MLLTDLVLNRTADSRPNDSHRRIAQTCTGRNARRRNREGIQAQACQQHDKAVPHSTKQGIHHLLIPHWAARQSVRKKKRPLSDLKRGPEKAYAEIRREARKRVACCSASVSSAMKFLRFRLTIALQRLCLVSAIHVRASHQHANYSKKSAGPGRIFATASQLMKYSEGLTPMVGLKWWG